jgi:hypothetical protein
MGDVTAYVAKVVADIEATRATFAGFERPGVMTHAVPFFGDVESAQVLTVGVNPSAGEFVGRAWPRTMTPSALAERLTAYFSRAPVPPHPWFAVWSDALASIGVSYVDGAAHLDLSPRATAAMGSHADWQGFARLVEVDARWFFELLPFCRAARALLMAGCVTKRWYINDVIARIAPGYGYRLTGRAEATGEGRVGFHRLVGPGCDLAVFFCSVSPSGNKRHLLIQRVGSHQTTIKKWLDAQSMAT